MAGHGESSTAASSSTPSALGEVGLVDPANSERKFYRDKETGLQREIWRPGDGDGEQTTDYFERIGPPLPIEKRWRLFQSDIGPITAKNQPPRFVILDDRAAFEVLKSDIQRAKLVHHWPHDFGGTGKLRIRRPHRGRAAIKDPSAEGDAKFESTQPGNKKDYYFTGVKDFQSIKYRYEPPKPEEKRKKRKPSRDEEDYNPRGHGHNQYTPKDMLVKHGAPSFSLKEPQAPRLSGLMRRKPEPRHIRNRAIAENAHFSVQREALRRQGDAEPPQAREEHKERRRLREQDADYRDVGLALGFASFPDDGEESDEPVPFRRPDSKPVRDDTPDFSVSQSELQIPRKMGFIERRAFEQKLAEQTIASIATNEDVTRIANELAQANVKLQQQAEQIERLTAELEEAQTVDSAWQVEAEAAQDRVAELEARNAELEKQLEARDGLLEAVQEDARVEI
ncbi:Hypothetical predicted protein [Lecanosticta acicola]|uniref:Uncharacterized protein n=1 Tax=Lecanosticta acicola TaxID=111012 RepID=A0AAI8Z5W4_9PEZI|nr:Hypothetical predicted protein [Lecanosticta acicola]